MRQAVAEEGDDLAELLVSDTEGHRAEERDEKIAKQPAVVAARALLRLAVGATFHGRADRPQALLVLLSDRAWAEPVAEAWRIHFKGGRRAERAGRALPGSADPHDWFCLAQSRPLLSSRSPSLDIGEVEQALAAGGELLILAWDAPALPPVVRAAMDRVVELPPMSAAVLRHVAGAMHGTGEGRARVGDEAAALITPSALRLAARRAGSAAEYAERAARIAEAAAAGPKTGRGPGPRGFARVPGLGPALDWGRALVADLAEFRSGRLPWADVDRGAVLVGPPGTGKTTFVSALAEEAGVPVIASSYAAWQSTGHQGDMLKAMRKSFDEARAAAPCLLFIDEVDSFPHRDRVRSDHADYVRGVVNGLLAELDGATSRDGVVVIGACNSADNLDPALTRPGRLDRIVPVGLPDFEGRAAILRVHLGPDLPGADLWQVARIAEGMSGAELEKTVREARRTARAAGRGLLLGDVMLAVAGGRGLELQAPALVAFN